MFEKKRRALARSLDYGRLDYAPLPAAIFCDVEVCTLNLRTVGAPSTRLTEILLVDSSGNLWI